MLCDVLNPLISQFIKRSLANMGYCVKRCDVNIRAFRWVQLIIMLANSFYQKQKKLQWYTGSLRRWSLYLCPTVSFYKLIFRPCSHLIISLVTAILITLLITILSLPELSPINEVKSGYLQIKELSIKTILIWWSYSFVDLHTFKVNTCSFTEASLSIVYHPQIYGIWMKRDV